MIMRHSERHRTDRIGWLRAAVLGANDGIVSTASLVLGVAAANATPRCRDGGRHRRPGRGRDVDGGRRVRFGPLAGRLGAGRRSTWSARSSPPTTRASTRSSPPSTSAAASILRCAKEVAEQLMAHDALGAHARDELGISEHAERATDPGGAHLGRELRRRRRPAPPGRCGRLRACTDSGRLGNVTVVPRAPGRRRRAASVVPT